MLLTEDSIFKSLILLWLNYIFPFLMFTSIYFSFECQHYSALLSQNISTAKYFRQYDFKIIFTSANKSTLYIWKINLVFWFIEYSSYYLSLWSFFFYTSYNYIQSKNFWDVLTLQKVMWKEVWSTVNTQLTNNHHLLQ